MENNVISNQKLKKIEKKLKKLQHIVLKEIGIECSIDKTSKILVIANAGLINGLTEEVVYTHFSKYGVLDTILLLPGKSCSFIQYNDISSAKSAYENFNGSLNIAQDSKPIYLLYATDLPDIKINKTWNEPIPGLIIIENFITQDEEEILLNLCNFDSNINSQMKHRQVEHYGYEFRYDINNVDKNKPLQKNIPDECNFWKRLEDTDFKNFIPNQLTVNHYLPGQGIPHHIDTHSAFEDPIMSLSLQSSIIMEFKKDNKHIYILLPQRSLAILSGECRYDWTHGITPRKLDIILTKNGFTSLERGTRTSFTFRKILQGECTCSYTSKCDSFHKLEKTTRIGSDDASNLENEHVHKVYESIAEHFDDTRHKRWPNVVDFLESFYPGSILVDVGCGNGKYLGVNKNVFDILVIANAGLINGLTEEVVYTHFSKYGVLDTILLLPGKSCSFIQYNNISSAKSAYENFNGSLNIAQDSKPIYLLYATDLPDIKINKTWNEPIPGLIIIENFITQDEEEILLNLCNFDSNINSQMKYRQVEHYGYEFRYDINNVDKNKPLQKNIPDECKFWNRLEDTDFKNFIPDQLTVNHYLPGQGIPHHIDTHSAFEDPIMSLSLQSSIIMEFKKDNNSILFNEHIMVAIIHEDEVYNTSRRRVLQII